MIKLLLTSTDIPSLTSFSGNIDADAIKPYIYLAQKNDIKRILGLDLYVKIYDDYVAGTLEGDYKIIYEDYVVEMLVFFSCSKYMIFGGYKTTNNGIHKVNIDGAMVPDPKEVNKLSAEYKSLANSSEINFYEYIKTVDLPEWTETTEDSSRNNSIPWY
tara:strand:+ start:12265 stop:12741 length:477 start_codon:yes stop_codon:yes gene_type:complete